MCLRGFQRAARTLPSRKVPAIRWRVEAHALGQCSIITHIDDVNSQQVRRRGSARRRVDEQRDVVPRARFDNVSRQETMSLGQFIREIRADSLDEVRPAMTAAGHAARCGHWVAGFVTYEAASAFDVAFDVARRSPKGPPLA